MIGTKTAVNITETAISACPEKVLSAATFATAVVIMLIISDAKTPIVSRNKSTVQKFPFTAFALFFTDSKTPVFFSESKAKYAKVAFTDL